MPPDLSAILKHYIKGHILVNNLVSENDKWLVS